MKKTLVAYLTLLALVFSLAIFSWGFSTAKFRLAGYERLSALVLILDALKVYLELEAFSDRSAHLISIEKNLFDQNENKVLAGEGNYLLFSHFNGESYQASLANSKGEIVHEWQVPFEEAGLLKPASQFGISKRNQTIHGVYLYPNGDLLLVIDYRQLIKVDKDSRFLWANKENIHHAVTVDSEGSIWTFNRLLKYNEESAAGYQQGYYFDDQILKLDSDGRRVDSWSITDLMINSGYEGLLLAAHADEEFWNSDPVHANDIQALTEAQASAFPGVEEGDLMLSLRSISTVLVVSLEKEKVVWSMTGPFLRQHDPEVDSNGVLWVFDNRNAWPQENAGAIYTPEGQGFGGSRILAFNPETREQLWSSEEKQGYPFFTSIMGRLQVLESGNLLVVEPEAGRIFELDTETNTLVWDYVNFMGEGDLGRISDADVYPAEQLEFLPAE